VDQRIEEYLNDAVSSWLPQAYPETASKADPAVRQALFFLADLTASNTTTAGSLIFYAVLLPQIFLQRLRRSPARSKQRRREYDVATEQKCPRPRLVSRLRKTWRVRCGGSSSRPSRRNSRVKVKPVGDKATAALAKSEGYSYSWLQIQIGLEKGVLFLSNGRHRR